MSPSAASLHEGCPSGGCSELAAERVARAERDAEIMRELRSVRSELRRLRPWLRTTLTIAIPVIMERVPAIIHALQ